jgi:hypothetical protein
VTLAHCEKKGARNGNNLPQLAGERGAQKYETDAEAPDFSFTENATAGPPNGGRLPSQLSLSFLLYLEVGIFLKMRRDSENKTKIRALDTADVC